MAGVLHKFKSRIERIETGIRMHVIPVPAEVADKLRCTNRVIISIHGVELKRAVQGKKSGSPYITVGKSQLTDLRLRLGSEVSVILKEDPNPTSIDFAAELLEALRQDAQAKQRWDTFTLGKQRSLNHYVATAKQEDTRIRRAVELVKKVRTHTLASDQS